MTKKAAVIGAGNMGYAILCGMAKSGIYDISSIVAAEKNEASRERADKLGIGTVQDPADAVKGAELVILAVKPNALEEVAARISGSIEKTAVIVSILAGKKLKTLERYFGEDAAIIRVMPNTPALIGCGVSGVCRNKNVTDSQLGKVISIFSSFGTAEEVGEELMDTVTGISGSGPAYAFMFIDGLARAGVENGMSEEQAKLFAAGTVLGAAKMVLESELSPEQLKINVCSPGGTTIEAVKVFENEDLYGMIGRAVDACIQKSKILGRE